MPKKAEPELVPYLGKFLIERAFQVTIDDPSLPCEVDLVVEVTDGIPEVVQLVATARQDGPPITGHMIRAIPVHTLLADAVANQARESERKRARPLQDGRFGGPLSTPTQSRQHLTDEFLQEVADVYRSSEALGKPVETVADYFSEARPNGKVPRATAARWVLECRRRGYLEESKRSQTIAARKK